MTEETDFIVVGSGIAGLRAAVALARFGRVAVLTKDQVTESNTEYAQGGVAVVLSDDDAIELHYQDTLDAGAGLCDAEAVQTLVEQGPRYITELIELAEQGPSAFDPPGDGETQTVARGSVTVDEENA